MIPTVGKKRCADRRRPASIAASPPPSEWKNPQRNAIPCRCGLHDRTFLAWTTGGHAAPKGVNIFTVHGAVMKIGRVLNRETRRGRGTRETRIHLRVERKKVTAHRGLTRAGLPAPPSTRLEKAIRVYRSIPRLPVRSGPGGEIDRNEATQAVGREFVGERTARWHTAAGEIAGREWAKRRGPSDQTRSCFQRPRSVPGTN